MMYHYVRRHDPSLDRGIHGLSPAAFTDQLGGLCRELEPIEWSDLCAWMRGEGSIPDRCFLLTFDDGLSDHIENVLPILEAWHLHGVFFVPGVVLTSPRMLPAHAVHLLMAALGEADFERELLDAVKRQGNGDDPYALFAVEDAEKLYHYESPSCARLKYLLTVALPLEVRNSVVASLFERHVGSSTEWSHRWYLGREDLATMQSLGHTIGGHGFDHDPYTRLALPDRIADLRCVADALREVLGPGARPFSYPFGRVDPKTTQACRNAGFAGAFTTEAHWIAQDGDVMRLPRIDTIHVTSVLTEAIGNNAQRPPRGAAAT
ncbi:MAG: polysaccharide deacetylase family protein [Planctomycetes bacterium]|nr:polysaccharide deacetylase family protein [Planctomycetota bacterium]